MPGDAPRCWPNSQLLGSVGPSLHQASDIPQHRDGPVHLAHTTPGGTTESELEQDIQSSLTGFSPRGHMSPCSITVLCVTWTGHRRYQEPSWKALCSHLVHQTPNTSHCPGLSQGEQRELPIMVCSVQLQRACAGHQYRLGFCISIWQSHKCTRAQTLGSGIRVCP